MIDSRGLISLLVINILVGSASGIMLLASVGVLLSPVMHRVLHRFHLESDGDTGA